MRRYAKNGGAARRRFSAIPEKPVCVAKKTPPPPGRRLRDNTYKYFRLPPAGAHFSRFSRSTTSLHFTRFPFRRNPIHALSRSHTFPGSVRKFQSPAISLPRFLKHLKTIFNIYKRPNPLIPQDVPRAPMKATDSRDCHPASADAGAQIKRQCRWLPWKRF